MYSYNFLDNDKLAVGGTLPNVNINTFLEFYTDGN